MASDLDHYLQLREDLGHLSVVPTLDGKKWRASFKRRGESSYTVIEHEDVAMAIQLAVGPKKGQSVEGLTNDVSDWLAVLAEAEKKRKQPYPHQTTEELVDKLPEAKKVRRRERTRTSKGKYDDLI